MSPRAALRDRFTVGDRPDAVGYGWFVALLGGDRRRAAGGYLQGIAITRLKVPPFVVTLGGMSVFRGAALLITDGGPISGFSRLIAGGARARSAPVPVLVIIFLAFAVLAHRRPALHALWPQVYAVGGNREAARLSGLNVQPCYCQRLCHHRLPRRAWRLPAVGPAELGRGGRRHRLRTDGDRLGGDRRHQPVRRHGGVFGTVIGAMLIGVLINGLVLMNVSSYVQQIIIGLIMIAVVAFDQFAKSRRLK